jgi:hypothetical protein
MEGPCHKRNWHIKEPLLLEADSKHIGLKWHFTGNDDVSVRVGILNGTQNE